MSETIKMSATNEVKNILKNRKTSKAILILSVFVFLFYLSVQVLISNVYKYAIVGALFELLSLPMLLLLVVLPILCIVKLIKSKGAARRYAVTSLALLAIVITILVLT